MSRYARRAGRRDIFEPIGVEIALNRGFDGLQLDAVDYWFWKPGEVCPCCGTTRQAVVEFKTGNAKLKDSQKNLLGRGAPLAIIRNVEEAEKIFGGE